MNDSLDREDCVCVTRQIRYNDGEWAREYETLPCAEHALAMLPGPSPAA